MTAPTTPAAAAGDEVARVDTSPKAIKRLLDELDTLGHCAARHGWLASGDHCREAMAVIRALVARPTPPATDGDARVREAKALCVVLGLDPYSRVQGATGHWWLRWEQVAIHVWPKFRAALAAPATRPDAEGGR